MSHGEDELDYSVVFQRTELGSVNGRKGKWIWTQCTEDQKNSWQYLDVDKADFQVSRLLITDRLKSRG